MKRQFLHEEHNRQDKTRKADYVEDLRLEGFTTAENSEWENWKARRRTVLESVRKSVAFVGEFEQLFSGGCTSFRETKEHSGRTHSAWTFDAKIGFYGRYILNADLPIIVDGRFEVVGTSNVRLSVHTLREIHRRGDTLHMSYEPNCQFSFGLQDWKKLVAARGDFSAIGYDMVTDAPLADFATLYPCSGFIRR